MAIVTLNHRIDNSKFNRIAKKGSLIGAIKRGMERGNSSLRQRISDNFRGKSIEEKSGTLVSNVEDSITGPTERGNEIVCSFGDGGTHYGRIHELGGPIVAKNAPYLVFFWEQKNTWVRTRSVYMPARKPFSNSAEEALPDYTEAIKQEIGNL